MNKDTKKSPNTLFRVLKLLFGYYPVLMPITCFCILFSAATAAVPAVFIQKVISVMKSGTF